MKRAFWTVLTLCSAASAASPRAGPSTLRVRSQGAILTRSEEHDGSSETSLAVMLSDVPSVCGLMARSPAGRQVNLAGITVTVTWPGQDTVMPGVYRIQPETAPDPKRVKVVAGYGKLDEHCRNVVGASGAAVEGQVTLKTVTSASVEGALVLRFQDGERISMQFKAPRCSDSTRSVSSSAVESCVGEVEAAPGPSEFDDAFAQAQRRAKKCEGPRCTIEVTTCAGGGHVLLIADAFTSATDYFDRRGAWVGSRFEDDTGQNKIQGVVPTCAGTSVDGGR